MLAQRLGGLSLEERSNKLAAMVPGKVLYDEALSATKVTMVKDEETDLVSLTSSQILSIPYYNLLPFDHVGRGEESNSKEQADHSRQLDVCLKRVRNPRADESCKYCEAV